MAYFIEGLNLQKVSYTSRPGGLDMGNSQVEPISNWGNSPVDGESFRAERWPGGLDMGNSQVGPVSYWGNSPLGPPTRRRRPVVQAAQQTHHRPGPRLGRRSLRADRLRSARPAVPPAACGPAAEGVFPASARPPGHGPDYRHRHARRRVGPKRRHRVPLHRPGGFEIQPGAGVRVSRADLPPRPMPRLPGGRLPGMQRPRLGRCVDLGAPAGRQPQDARGIQTGRAGSGTFDSAMR